MKTDLPPGRFEVHERCEMAETLDAIDKGEPMPERITAAERKVLSATRRMFEAKQRQDRVAYAAPTGCCSTYNVWLKRLGTTQSATARLTRRWAAIVFEWLKAVGEKEKQCPTK